MKILDFEKLRNSFRVAFYGLKSVFAEQTFRIFCFCSFLVVIFMFIFKTYLQEKIILIFLITLISALEMINSQIEKILDILEPNHNPKVKIIKDISAGAVLLACFGAAIIAALIFLPKFVK